MGCMNKDEHRLIHFTVWVLVEKHDFSEERVNKQLEKLNEIKEKKKQKGLGDWVKK